VLWAIAGAVGAGLIAVGVNVASDRINDSSSAPAPTSSTPSCTSEQQSSADRLGHNAFAVSLSPARQNCWRTSLDEIRSGDTLDVPFEYRSFTGRQQNDVTLSAHLTKGFTCMRQTTVVSNAERPKGAHVSDNIAGRGINIGSYANGANAWVIFRVKLLTSLAAPYDLTVWPISGRVSYPSGDNGWRSAGVVSPGGCDQ